MPNPFVHVELETTDLRKDPRNPVNLNTPEVEQKLLKQKGQ